MAVTHTSAVRANVYRALAPLAGGKPYCEQLSGRTDSSQWLVRLMFKMKQSCGWFCHTVSK